MRRTTLLAPGLPEVCRLGLASRGNGHLRPEDVEHAIDRGINYLNWCGHPDGMSRAIAGLGNRRKEVVVAVQLEAGRELAELLEELRTDYLDVVTLYYVESPEEWKEIVAPGGGWEFLDKQKQLGTVKMIGLTSHQRPLAAEWAQSGRLDLLMIRYNAAHRGAEREVFPVTAARQIPVVTFTGLRWKALLEPTPDDPENLHLPTAPDCYRFCLAHPDVAVSLMAPANREELEENLSLMDDWRALGPEEYEALRRHGDRVRAHAGVFW